MNLSGFLAPSLSPSDAWAGVGPATREMCWGRVGTDMCFGPWQVSDLQLAAELLDISDSGERARHRALREAPGQASQDQSAFDSKYTHFWGSERARLRVAVGEWGSLG